MGHLISTVELGKFILKHHPSYSIIILTLTNSFKTGSIVSYVHNINIAIPAIKFHHLPHIPLDIESYPSSGSGDIVFDLISRSINNVTDALRAIAPTALVIDLYCASTMVAAKNLNIPVYYFVTSGACAVAGILHFPTLDRDNPRSFKDMNDLIYLPGLPPIPSSDMPVQTLDRNSKSYSDFLQLSHCLPKSDGIIINTFSSLEPKPIKAITDGLCVQNGHTPPLYCVGPLLADGSDDTHECLNWLDSQPAQSVVYLGFGSECVFSDDQLKEIAKGLEMSGHRFLWVIRSQPTIKKEELFLPPPVLDLNMLLPDGFLERTRDRGLVVNKWAPQVAVLIHKSIGGFVTHCGWNSMLEATRAGVPMVAWPLYAEQKMNRIMMVEEMKLALPMDEIEGGKVAAAEIDKRIRQLMESEEGKFVREVVQARKEDATVAMSEGGSSRVALAKLVESWDAMRRL